MTYTVKLRRNCDGLVRDHVEAGYDWDDVARYMWTEGNYSCDCNRALFFARAGGDKSEREHPCGDEAYSLVSVTYKDRQVYPDA